jgi:hypothetical protein
MRRAAACCSGEGGSGRAITAFLKAVMAISGGAGTFTLVGSFRFGMAASLGPSLIKDSTRGHIKEV